MLRRLTFDDRTLVIGAGVVSLLLVAVTAALGLRENTGSAPTTYSANSQGAKAVLLLLQQSRYPIARWDQPLRDLPSGAAVVVLADPEAGPTNEDRSAIRRFLEGGGRVIATGVSAAFFLPEHRAGGITADPVAGMTWKRMGAMSPSAITAAAPEITLAPGAYWPPDAFATPMYGEDADTQVVVKYRVGKGDVIWLAAATPFTNAGVSEPGNLEFVLACLGDSHGPILWDERGRAPRQAAAPSKAASPLGWTALQVTLLAAAILLTFSRRSGPIMPAASEGRLSPLEFVRTLGALYRRAGAGSVAVDIAYQQFRFRLTRRLGLSRAATADELQRAVRARWNLDDPALGELLRACDAARREPRLSTGRALLLTRSLWDYSNTLNLAAASKEIR
jgi:hypothetical protein